MTAQVAAWRASYTAGDWLVLAGPTAIVALDPDSDIAGSQIEQIWSGVLASASMDDLVGRLTPLDRTVSPRLLAVFWNSDGMRTLVRGPLTLREVKSGQPLAEGDGVITWREVGLDQVSSAVVALPSASGSSGQALPLVVGAVRAGSLRIDASAAAAVQSAQATLAPQAARPVQADATDATDATDARDAEDATDEESDGWTTGEQTELESDWDNDWDLPTRRADNETDHSARHEMENAETSLIDPATLLAAAISAPAPAPTPSGTSVAGPAVEAVFCVQGDANPPGASGCWVCGQPIQDSVRHLIARPMLARLRLPDGSSVALDRPVLIGRAPSATEQADEGLAAESPRLVTVPSPSHDISRTHVRIAPEGWQILVTDLRSTNGTSVVTPDPGVNRIQLEIDQPLSVALGTLVELGDGVAILVDAAAGGDEHDEDNGSRHDG